MTRLRDHHRHDSFTSSLENLLEDAHHAGYCSSRSLLQVLDGIEQLVLAAVNAQGHGQVRLITRFFMSQADLQELAGDLKDGVWTMAEAGTQFRHRSPSRHHTNGRLPATGGRTSQFQRGDLQPARYNTD